MTRPIRLLLFLIFTGIIIWFLNSRIDSNDLRFYSGKDNGYFARLESICILSAIFWTIMSDQNKIKNFFIGLLIGLLSSISSYLVMLNFEENAINQLIFHIIACLIFITTYFIMNITLIKKNNYR